MKTIVALLSAFVLFFPAGLSARSSVWKVTKGDRSLYVGGTCHVLRAQDYPLPEEFNLAYGEAESIVFEIDPNKMEDPAVAIQLLQACTYTDGRTLKSVLSREAYDALASAGAEAGLPIDTLGNFKPGLVATMLTVQQLLKMGVNQEGVDGYYAKKAKADGKEILSLETVEFQIQMIASMGEGHEDDFILYGLQDLKQIETDLADLIECWRSGDLDQLETLLVDDMKQIPALYEDLIATRNKNWLPRLEALLATPEVEFVLVGVGHAVGEDGILALLESKGYSVERR